MNILEWLRKCLSVWRGIFSVIFCLVLSGMMISLETPGRVVFHEVLVGTLLFPIQFGLTSFQGVLHLSRDNVRLLGENAALRAENDLLREWLKRIPNLDEMERFRTASSLRLKAGRVIAQDAGRLQTAWVVDLGRADSVDVNMPVLTSRGVVGKTAKCFTHHSVVQLLVNPASKVSVVANRSRARGILEAYGGGRLVARFPAGSEVREGDTLVTAGLGGVFPKGLRIGIASPEIAGTQEGDDVIRSFPVRAFQDLNSVEDVFVLIKEDLWMASDEGELP